MPTITLYKPSYLMIKSLTPHSVMPPLNNASKPVEL